MASGYRDVFIDVDAAYEDRYALDDNESLELHDEDPECDDDPEDDGQPDEAQEWYDFDPEA